MNWDKHKFVELFVFQKKSKVKAGDGLKQGIYPFYTSSNILSKFINEYLFIGPGLVFGTGGMASVHYADGEFSASTDCFVTLPKGENVCSKFIYYFLSGNLYLLENGFKGAGLKHLSKDYLSTLQIPLPPIETQRKIVAILDKANELVQNDKKTLEKYDQLAQSVFLEMFGDIEKNDRQWETEELGNLCKSRLGKMLDSKKQTGKYKKPYLRNANVQWGKIDTTNLFLMDFDKKDQIEFRLSKGDILVCEGGEVGRTAIWNNEIEECYFQKALHRVRVHSERLNQTYYLYFMMEMARLDGFRKYVTSATIPHLTGVKLKRMVVVLPPIELQNRFAEIIKHIETQKKLARQSLQKSEELFLSLLKGVFKGGYN